VSCEARNERSDGGAGQDGARSRDHWRRASAGHGAADRIARARKARGPDRGVDGGRATDAALRPDLAHRLRHTWRRRAGDNREREGPDEGSSGENAEPRDRDRLGDGAGGEGGGGVWWRGRTLRGGGRPVG